MVTLSGVPLFVGRAAPVWAATLQAGEKQGRDGQGSDFHGNSPVKKQPAL